MVFKSHGPECIKLRLRRLATELMDQNFVEKFSGLEGRQRPQCCSTIHDGKSDTAEAASIDCVVEKFSTAAAAAAKVDCLGEKLMVLREI